MQSEIKTLDTSGLYLSQIVAGYILPIATAVVFSKSGVDVSEIGTYEAFIVIAAVGFILTCCLLKCKLSILWASSRDVTLLKIIKNVLIFNMLVAVIAAVAFALSTQVFHKPTFIDNQLFLLLLLYIVVSCPTLLVEHILVRNRQIEIRHYTAITSALQLLLVGLPPIFKFDITVSIYGLLCAFVVKLGWLIFVTRNFSLNHVLVLTKSRLRQLNIVYTLLMLNIVPFVVDSLVVIVKRPLSDFALFRYSILFVPISILLNNTLSRSMVRKFTDYDIKSPLAELKSEVSRLNNFLFTIAIICMLTSKWIYPTVLNPNFEGCADLFNVYLLLLVGRVLPSHIMMIGRGNNRKVMKILSLGIVANAIFSLWFIDVFGLIGVAYATLMCYTVEKIMFVILCKKEYGIKLSEYMPMKQYVPFSIILFLAFIVTKLF